ncbi:MAG: protein kinase [Deltaproteobacteria bacterium]|nr:protein kinase [Deltaproteobacteria bacterium]
MFKPVQFGKYYLTDRIAVGGMAEIYRAKLYGVSGFEKQMVVKQILPQYARNAEFIKMFIDEAKISVSLSHGNIIPVYELGRLDGIYFIAMDYVRGKNLQEIAEVAAEKQLPFSVEHAIFVAIEILKGLDYAHRRADDQGTRLGVVHRDISPSNVMVTMAGEVKIADFGIAKATDKLGVTDAGVVKGSYGYMSPEQIQGLDVDYHTDIFNTGILLHEMATGRRLFEGSEAAMVEKIKNAIVTLPSMVSPKVPVELDPIILEALAEDPEDRYHNANEFQLALSRILFSTGAGATSATLAEYMQELFPAENRPSVSEEVVVDATPPPIAGNNTRSYAVREEFEDVGMPGEELRARRPASSSVAPISTAPGAPPQDVTLALSFPLDEELTSRKTADFRGKPTKRSLPARKRPDVPELHQKARAPHGGRLEALGALGLAPLATEEQSPRFFQGDPPQDEASVVEPPASQPKKISKPKQKKEQKAHNKPVKAASPEMVVSSKKGPRSDASVMALLLTETQQHEKQPDVSLLPPKRKSSELRSGDDDSREDSPPEHPLDGLSASLGDVSLGSLMATNAPTGAGANAEPLPLPTDKSGLLAGTMSLFVQGLDKEPGLDTGDLVVPHTIKPTVLGWVLVLLLLGAALLFVLYKKTTVFSGDDGAAMLSAVDATAPKTPTTAKTVKKGSLTIKAEPSTALIFQHIGESPTQVRNLEAKGSYLLRFERDGYRPAHKLLKGAENKGQLLIALQPVGAGARQEVPNPPPGVPPPNPPTSNKETVTIEVKTQPPAASVWRFVGQGKAKLSELPRQRYYFKVIAKGHHQSFISISSRHFEKNDGNVEETITLKAKEGAATQSDSKAAAKAEPPKTSAKAAPVKSAVAKAAKVGRAKKKRVRKPRARPAKRWRPKKIQLKRKKPRRKKKPGLATPSWAR